MHRILALAFLTPILLQAQAISSSLAGFVTDASGAAVSGANIALTDTDTNLTAKTTSTEAGVFRLGGLRPGAYTLAISKPGFQPYRVNQLTFIANSEVSHHARLQVAAQTDQVTVVSEAALIDAVSANGTRSGTFTSQETADLPLIAGGQSRNFRILSFQLPGVASAGNAHAPFNVNGTRSYGSMNIMVDGAEFIDINYGRLLAQGLTEQPVSMETVDSLEMQTGNFKAEYGRATGSISNLITKRGTNSFHGSAYSFFLHSSLNARNAAQLEKPFAATATPGITFGGPIRKDRTFFFLGLEISARDGSASSVIQTLTDTQRAAVVPWMKPLADLYPSANAGANLSSGNVPSTRTFRQWIGKLDHAFTPTHRLGLKYNYSKQQGNTINRIPALNFTSYNGNQMYVVNLDSTFTPRSLNQAKAAYVTYDNTLNPDFPRLGIPEVNGIVGSVITTGLQTLFSPFRWPRATRTHNYNFSDDFTFSSGRHVFKSGAILRRLMSNTSNDQNFNGQMIFTSVNNFVQGIPLNYQIASGNSRTDQRITEYGFYFQDDFRATSNLTLNLGLRYEFYSPFKEKFNRIPQLYGSDTNNFMPRLGFAYNVKGQSKTVIRGGAGAFYSALFLDIVGQSRFAPPNVTTLVNVFPQGRPNLTRPDFLANATRASAITTIDPNLVNPIGYNWNLTVERQLFHPSTVLSTAYVGSKQNFLTRNRRPNGGDNLPQPQRPNPAIGAISHFDSSGNSNYHSFQAMLRTVIARNLTLRSSYTFSAAIDDGSDATGLYPIDERNLRLDRGRSDFDQPHILSSSAVYALPLFKSNRWLGGWQLAGTFLYRSALPLSILSNTNNFNGSLINRVNAISGSILDIHSGSQAYALAPGFTPAALQPAPGLTGTLGRNTARAFAYRDASFSLQKTLRLTEALSLNFRAEAFNILNFANYAAPINNIANPNFGRSLSAQDPRQLQFACKILF